MAAALFMLITGVIFTICYGFNIASLQCKLSPRGSDFIGKISKSGSGAVCDDWSSSPLSEIHDTFFPDGSKILAKNYCRNPTWSTTGPWCYVKGVNESCNIPFCAINECRITGTGKEYVGTLHHSAWFYPCASWSDTEFAGGPSLCYEKDNVTRCDNCRNPDLSPSGPWCMAVDPSKMKKRQLCDVPFCSSSNPVIMVRDETQVFKNFFRIHTNPFYAKLKFLHPDAWIEGHILLCLSVTDVATELNHIKEWGSGITLILGHKMSAVQSPKGHDKLRTPAVLTAGNSTNVQVRWTRSNHMMTISVFINNKAEPDMVTDFDTTGMLLEYHDLQYASFLGTSMFLQLSSADAECLALSTSGGDGAIWLQLARTTERMLFHGAVRITSFAELILTTWPDAKNKYLIEFNIYGDISLISVEENQREIIEMGRMGQFKPYDWYHFRVEFWSSHLLVYHEHDPEETLLLNATDLMDAMSIMWIAPLSLNVSHWSFNCHKKVKELSAKHEPPECITNQMERYYNGTWHISHGLHCLPWIDKRIPKQFQTDDLFEKFGGKVISKNYCRNLDGNKFGPFCFVFTDHVIRQTCNVPRCSFTECKMTGIGTDYVGSLKMTRSNLTCIAKDPALKNITCHNPSKDIGGPWCHTSHPFVAKDYCAINDCERPSGSILLLSMAFTDRSFYLLPSWKKHGFHFWVKNWDPEKEGNLQISLRSRNLQESYLITMGGGKEELVSLDYVTNNDGLRLTEKLSPHLIPSAFWRGLWLRFGHGKVQLGREGLDYGFLEWESDTSDHHLALDPAFIDFSAEAGKWIGLSFRMTDCMIERVLEPGYYNLWPINIRKPNDTGPLSFRFLVQATGTFLINFIKQIDRREEFVLEITNGKQLQLLYMMDHIRAVLHTEYYAKSLLTANKWTVITGEYDQTWMRVSFNGNNVFNYNSSYKPIIFYWFSMEIKTGELSWTANCDPLDLGPNRRDGKWGKWSPWECTVTCGKGEGRITRNCDNPPPNVLGDECPGIDVYQGVCNDFPCGSIPPDLRKKIRKRLSLKAKSEFAAQSSSAHMDCEADLLKEIYRNAPNVTTEWTLNGFPINRSHEIRSDQSIEVTKLTPKDSGVYVCSVKWEQESIVVAVAALTVTTSRPTESVRETLPFNLECRGSTLGHIYADLSQQWKLGDEIWKNYGPTDLDAVNDEKFETVLKEHQGIWTCVIQQEELGLKWETNWVRLEVLKPPNFWTNLREDKATAFLFDFVSEEYVPYYFSALVGGFLVVSLVGSAICCCV